MCVIPLINSSLTIGKYKPSDESKLKSNRLKSSNYRATDAFIISVAFRELNPIGDLSTTILSFTAYHTLLTSRVFRERGGGGGESLRPFRVCCGDILGMWIAKRSRVSEKQKLLKVKFLDKRNK